MFRRKYEIEHPESQHAPPPPDEDGFFTRDDFKKLHRY